MSDVEVIRLLDLSIEEINQTVKEMTVMFNQYEEMGSWNDSFQSYHSDPEFQYYLLKVKGKYIPALMVCYRTPKFLEGECTGIWIAKEHRRNGYGRLMVNTINPEYVTVASNDISTSFWTSLGYKPNYWKGASGMWYRPRHPPRLNE